MEQQVNKLSMLQQQQQQQLQQMTRIPHCGMIDHTLIEQHQGFTQEEILREEERGQGLFSEGVTTINDPVTLVGDKEDLRLQGT